jgi:rubrerythrin
VFETERDALAWYESQPQVITKKFIDSIPWKEVQEHPINPEFFPVLIYMRDVESYTEIWYRDMLRTPTGRDPYIRRFMDRWGVEEMQHGSLINRFLEEAGVPTSEHWVAEARAKVPFSYSFTDTINSYIANLFGQHFSGAHMVWGAINEMTTLQAYRQLWRAAGHPVLERVLRAIAHEESSHAHFYWSIARIRLERSRFTRELAKFVINRFWNPVGEGTKPRNEVNATIGKLFGGDDGITFFDRNVTQRVAKLPGFSNLTHTTKRIAQASASL